MNKKFDLKSKRFEMKVSEKEHALMIRVAAAKGFSGSSEYVRHTVFKDVNRFLLNHSLTD